MTLKEKLEAAEEAVRKAREEQIQKKTERDGLQQQYDELVEQIKTEFNLDPDELESHAASLEEQATKLLEEVEEILNS